MNRIALGVLLSVVLCLAFATPSVASEPGSLSELEQRLADTSSRLEALIKEAKKDSRERDVVLFLGYSPAQRKKKSRVRAEDILKLMADASADFGLRRKAMKALAAGALEKNDPDLSTDSKKGRRTARGYFFHTHVRKLLANEDRNTRMLADALFEAVWGRVTTNSGIFNYKVDEERTWRDAVNGWKDYLKKR